MMVMNHEVLRMCETLILVVSFEVHRLSPVDCRYLYSVMVNEYNVLRVYPVTLYFLNHLTTILYDQQHSINNIKTP